MDENLQNLNIILSAMKKDHLGTADFTKYFNKVIELVKKIDARNIKEFSRLTQTITSLSKKLEKDGSETNDKLQRQITAELESLLRRFSAKSKELDNKIKEADKKLSGVRDGKDANEDYIIDTIREQLKMEIPKLDDFLNSIPEKEDITLLEKLKELEEKIEKLGLTQVRGAVVRSPAPRVENMTGTKNGTNKDFTVAHKPEFITFDGQILYVNNGFTLAWSSGVITVTFDNAPQSDSVIKNHY